ncbi:Mitogen-activated protein kinase kinase kinase [Actinidia chinensis var. chinensis]|uniref:mitogen-activated protein kinase kinase kinase n=1 Tax=Actinidia chinensis var. chinensis TaxID=1590841 RepID=A0A2R6Q010_ACTCC|nr:Mitogen-activated protein kinase kinase kinase [Actinidia chinensis var. chinensis]
MPSFKSIFSYSSSSSSSSPSDSPLKHGSNDTNFFKNGGGRWESKRRLTRQRKLRHLADVDARLNRPDQSRSLPVSPDSGSPSPANLEHWSAAAVPQPLPLPEFGALNRPNDQSNLPSPKGGPIKGDERNRTESSNPSGSASGSYFSPQSIRKNTDRAVTNSPKTPTYSRRGFPQDLDVESVPLNFRLNVPARSAPTSGFSSPALSPKRFRTVDLFHSPFMSPQEFRGLSALEGPVSDTLACSPPPVRSARHSCTPDHSPIHSPKWQSACQSTRNPTSVAFHSHHKSLPEGSMGCRDGSNQANPHPLPLPPGGPKPAQSTTTRYSMEKQDLSMKKSQWLKGKLIGRGTYGSVFEAINCETGALCAMKEVDIIGDDPKSAECIRQLEQEIKVLQHLKHPNIVQYYGCEVVEERFCIYLEYVHPGSINKYVRDHFGAVTENVVRNFTRHILSGLAYLHSTKTIHRDIKGANLLVDASGVVKLADFGLAKHLTGSAIDLSLKGSPHWMAPEVLQSVMRKDSNPQLAYAVDIWSVGCTVIEILNGKPPWSEFTGVQAMFNVLNKSPTIPETLSSEGKDFLRWCFKRNPVDRPSAAWLLDHPFLHSSHDQDVSVCMREFSGINIADIPHSPRDRTQNMKGSVPTSPGARIRQLPCDGETSAKLYPESSDTGAAPPCHSPRSTLEALPNVSSPEFSCRSHFICPAANSLNSLHLASGTNNQYISSRPHTREIPHL